MIVDLPLSWWSIVAGSGARIVLQETTLTGLAERVVSDVQRDMLASQIRLDIAAFSDVHSGELVSKFLYDATLLRASITRSIPTLGTQLLTLIAMAGVMIYDDWQLAVISVVLLPPVAWVTGMLGRSLKKSSQRSMEETSSLSRTLSEALAGRRIIKAYNLENHAVDNADVRIQARLRYILRAVRSRGGRRTRDRSHRRHRHCGDLRVRRLPDASPPIVVAKFMSFVAAMLLAQQPVRMLSQLWTILSEGVAAANRIFAVIDQHPQIVNAPDAKPLAVTAAAVRFDNVGFAYHADAPALNSITLDIQTGQKVALVGPSGAGKSTIFNILLRFYDCDSGVVTIDGQDISHVTLESLRNNIALVTQESILFDESVADNIALGRKDATREEIIEAARNAAADGFIRELPDGYDTGVGEGALNGPAASASASRLPARCCAMRPSFCSTKPPPRSTPTANARCRMRWRGYGRQHDHRHRPSPVDRLDADRIYVHGPRPRGRGRHACPASRAQGSLCPARSARFPRRARRSPCPSAREWRRNFLFPCEPIATRPAPWSRSHRWRLQRRARRGQGESRTDFRSGWAFRRARGRTARSSGSTARASASVSLCCRSLMRFCQSPVAPS